MKIPRSVKLQGKRWKIKRVKNLKNEEDQPRMGLTDTIKRIIEIDADLTDTDLKETFWHELTHAALYEGNLTDIDGGLTDLVEEQVCEIVSDMILAIRGKL